MIAAIPGFDAAFDHLPLAEKREFMQLMCKHVELHPDRVEVELYEGRTATRYLQGNKRVQSAGTVPGGNGGVPGAVPGEQKDRERKRQTPGGGPEFVTVSEWLRIVTRSRTGESRDSPLTLRVVRRLPSKNLPSSNKKKEKKEIVGVLGTAVAMQRRLGEPGVGNRAGLARVLGVSRSHVTQSMAVLDVPGPLMDTLVRAEKSGRPVTVAAWRKVKGLPEDAAIWKLREMGYS